MALVKVGSVSRLEPDSVTEVAVGGEYYAICNAGGRITALGGTCIHRGGPLGHGAIQGNHVYCPWHMWGFDCSTGEYDRDPGLKMPTFPVRIEGDDILLDLP